MKSSQLKIIVENKVLDFFAPPAGQYVQCWAGYAYKKGNGKYFECLQNCSTTDPETDANFSEMKFDGWQKEDGSYLES